MAGYADMAALNKSSGKVATFAVRIVGARASEYTFTSKRDTKPVTQHKSMTLTARAGMHARAPGFSQFAMHAPPGLSPRPPTS